MTFDPVLDPVLDPVPDPVPVPVPVPVDTDESDGEPDPALGEPTVIGCPVTASYVFPFTTVVLRVGLVIVARIVFMFAELAAASCASMPAALGLAATFCMHATYPDVPYAKPPQNGVSISACENPGAPPVAQLHCGRGPGGIPGR